MKDITSVQSGIVQENDVNNPSVQTYKGKNQFPQSFQHPSTCQYGYVDPVAVAKCEVGDVFPYKFVTDLNTFTMASPFKGEVKQYSAAFKVPMEAIYPKTYDLLFSLAQKGDQVPQDSPDVNGVVEDSARCIFNPRRFYDTLMRFYNQDFGRNYDNPDNFSNYIKFILLLESVFSDGSIFAKMNIHLNSTIFIWGNQAGEPVEDSFNGAVCFDYAFDNYIYPAFVNFLNYSKYFSVDVHHYTYDLDDFEYSPIFRVTTDSLLWGTRCFTEDYDDADVYFISPDRFFELMRTGDYNAKIVRTNVFDSGVYQTEAELLFWYPYFAFDVKNVLPQAINIEPIIAYQLACVHFFNNPKVDFLYTADLWRDNLFTIVSYVDTFPTFDYNGTNVQYDVASNKVMNFMITSSDVDGFYKYFFALFSYQRSLRYGDYFTGARPEPIGVGDISLDEDGGSINSLEVARKLQLTRLLHKVAITGPEHSQQIKYIFGGRLPEVPKDVPIRLSLEEFDIDGFETVNTGDAQLSPDSPNITTTNLRLTDSKFMFEVQVDEPCWLVMVQYFEAHRIYSNTIDRFAYHYNIYDDFIPDMQFTGDQDVKQSELMGVYGDPNSPYAYHLRNMEYKQRYSYASGGFIRLLKSWAFITDNKDGNPSYRNITPEYIRSSPSEFDRFYKSLLGHSLGSRFHFITFNTNVMAPYRQMVYAPEILA